MLVVVIAVAALTAMLFVWPASRVPENADAVVVLGGGSGERLERGLELMEAGVSDTLVVSTGPTRSMRRADIACGQQRPWNVLCFSPDPVRTSGEARAIGALAQEHGWSSIAVVTSTYHLTRARTLVTQCFDGELSPVAAATSRRSPAFWWHVVQEWLGLGGALTFDRAC